MNASPVRVRFAPSPTGQLHVGNCRTAVINWLFARSSGAESKFILRIEDSDTVRSTVEAEDSIIADMRWLGITWDEGPRVGGPHGPYRQSERFSRYLEAAEKLVGTGAAYRCFCSEEELEQERLAAKLAKVPPKYSGKCAKLKREEIDARLQANEPYSIRFKVPEEGKTGFLDVIRGHMDFENRLIGDFIIVRSDGTAAYNLAVVVDDGDMNITHVLRGEDHLSNTPRQIMLANAMGLTPPVYGHLSVVLGEDNQKLSKRSGDTSIGYFRGEGILPAALVNYLAILGSSIRHDAGEHSEVMRADEIVRTFDISRTGLNQAKFTVSKLKWLNHMHMERLAADELISALGPYLATEMKKMTDSDPEKYLSALDAVRGMCSTLKEISARLGIFYSHELGDSAIDALRGFGADGGKVLAQFSAELNKMTSLGPEEYHSIMKQVAAFTGSKGKKLYMPIRLALTGANDGPELDKIVSILGMAEVTSRISAAIEKAGVGK